MNKTLESQVIKLSCPHCGHQLSQTIGQLQADPALVCPACSGIVNINAADLRSKIASVKQQLADLARAVGRLGQ